MAISIFDMFSIGIGPSSSHTVGPMRAGRRFLDGLERRELFERTVRIKAEMYGSLGATGLGHGTDRAVLLGLMGELPETVDTDSIPARMETVRETKQLRLDDRIDLRFDLKKDLVFHRRQSLPGHPNGMRFTAFDGDGEAFHSRIYYSVGGGFVVDDDQAEADALVPDTTALPHPFSSGAELLAQCKESGLSISPPNRPPG